MKTFRTVLLYLLGWLIAGLISTSQTLLVYETTSSTVPIRAIMIVGMPYWIAWALLAPIVILATRMVPPGRNRWFVWVPTHLALFVAVWTGVVALSLLLRSWLGIPSNRWFGGEMISALSLTLLLYIFVTLATRLNLYLKESRERAVAEARMRESLSEARLDALRAQLHPHFLFNTMHAIAAQIRSTPETAEDMLADLAELLRHSIDESVGHEVPLRDEVAFIERYLAIQRARFGDRLEIVWEISDDAMSQPVPSLILQPLIENAIEHGIAELRTGGRLAIRAALNGTSLRIEVENDGAAVDPDALEPERWRLGLANTRARLETLYGNRHEMQLAPRTGGGARVAMTLPTSAPLSAGRPE